MYLQRQVQCGATIMGVIVSCVKCHSVLRKAHLSSEHILPTQPPSELRLVLTLFASEGKVHFASRSQSAGGALDWRPLATVMSLNGAETCARQ